MSGYKYILPITLLAGAILIARKRFRKSNTRLIPKDTPDGAVGAIRKEHLVRNGEDIESGVYANNTDSDFSSWANKYWRKTDLKVATDFYELDLTDDAKKDLSDFFKEDIEHVFATDLSVSHSFNHSKENRKQKLKWTQFLKIKDALNNGNLYVNENTPDGTESIFAGIPLKIESYHGKKKSEVFFLFRKTKPHILEHWTTFVGFLLD